jgi:hypothetical protein
LVLFANFFFYAYCIRKSRKHSTSQSTQVSCQDRDTCHSSHPIFGDTKALIVSNGKSSNGNNSNNNMSCLVNQVSSQNKKTKTLWKLSYYYQSFLLYPIVVNCVTESNVFLWVKFSLGTLRVFVREK